MRFKTFKKVFFISLVSFLFCAVRVFAHEQEDPQEALEELFAEYIEKFKDDKDDSNPYQRLDDAIKNYIFFGNKIQFDSFGDAIDIYYTSEKDEGTKYYYEDLMDELYNFNYDILIERIKRIKFSAIFYCDQRKAEIRSMLSNKRAKALIFKYSKQRKKYILETLRDLKRQKVMMEDAKKNEFLLTSSSINVSSSIARSVTKNNADDSQFNQAYSKLRGMR